MNSTPFLQELRHRTGASHQALENNKLSANLLSPHVTAIDYSLYLQRLYGFVRGFEQNVYPMLQTVVTDLSDRRKTTVIEADLAALGVDPLLVPFVEDAFFRDCFYNTARAMGGLYVMEGSTLGGMMIHKHLQKTLGETITSIYFTVYGAQTGSRWKTFLSILVATAAQPGLQEDIIHAAKETFAALEQWLQSASRQPVVATNR